MENSPEIIHFETWVWSWSWTALGTRGQEKGLNLTSKQNGRLCWKMPHICSYLTIFSMFSYSCM